MGDRARDATNQLKQLISKCFGICWDFRAQKGAPYLFQVGEVSARFAQVLAFSSKRIIADVHVLGDVLRALECQSAAQRVEPDIVVEEYHVLVL